MNLSRALRAAMRTHACSAGVLAFCLASPALASEQPSNTDAGQPATGTSNARAPQADDEEDEIGLGVGSGEIIVEGQRLRGQLDVEQAPLLELDEVDIAAEGVTSIADLVTQIVNQTGSARGRGGGGRPVILVNGIRIGSFRELASYPPEALARVEVFPEEVAQRFGFPPDRRVVNLILKENYASREVEFEFEAPTRGGYWFNEQELGYLRIADGGRLNFNLEFQDTTLLTEDERDIIQTPGSISDISGDPDQAAFRSLVADNFNAEANLSWAKAVIDDGTSLSANINYVRNEDRNQDGLNIVTLTDAAGNSAIRTFGEDTPLERRISSDTLSGSGSLTRPVNAFRLTTTFDASLSETETEIDQRFDTQALEDAALAGTLAIDGDLPSIADAGFEVARRRSISGVSQTTFEGPVANLPGGEVLATFDAGLEWQQIDSSDTRTLLATELTRRQLSTGANLVVPITSRRNGFADALGSLTLTAQAGLEDLSDFGLLGDYTVGLNWAPFDNLDVSATYIYREVAPSLSNLGDPIITNFNVPVFDFTTGETVLATVTTGGNPDLLAETQRDWKFAINWELPWIDNTRFTVEYIRNRSDDVVSAFPQVTPEIEAAFPGRIVRDAEGTLVSVDQRSVSFAETRADRLNFTLTTRGSIGGGQQGRGGGRGFGGPPPGAAPGAGRPQRAGGPPTEEQRARFMQFRERVCADDGLDILTRLVDAVESGQDLTSQFPDFDPQRFEQILSRVRDENGEITPERLAQFRERFCSFDPAMFAGRGGQGQGGQGGQAPAQEGRPQGGPQRGPGGGNPFSRNFRGFRYFVTFNHTLELDNEILIAPGVDVLDQLDGDATGAFGFPRHTSRLEAGIFGRGIGMRLSGEYTGETRLNGTGLPDSSDIFFDDIVRFDLRVFANLDQLTDSSSPILKNFRVSLRADNVFDAQRRVTDENGDTPINYQAFLIDPVGLYVGVDLRKLF